MVIVLLCLHFTEMGIRLKRKKSVKGGVCYDGNEVWFKRIVSELTYALILIGWMFLSQEE